MYATRTDYREAWDSAYTMTPAIPLSVDIELASICQLRCPFCAFGDSDFAKGYLNSKDWDGRPIRRFMPTEMALKIIDECAAIGVPAIKPNFRGESTLHPDYSKILRYALAKITDPEGCARFGAYDVDAGKPAFHDILVNTNANCPDKSIDGLMAATKVMVSLDSCNPAIYPKVRIGGKMERAFEVIRELKRRGHPDLWVRRVIAQENKHEDFVGAVKRIFGDDTKVSEHFAFGGRNKDYAGCQSNGAPEDWERTYCGYPSQRVVITASGEFVPCCVSWRGELRPPFQYPAVSISEYWNSDWRKNLEAGLRANIITNPVCKTCTSYMAYKRPERKFVQDVPGRAAIS